MKPLLISIALGLGMSACLGPSKTKEPPVIKVPRFEAPKEPPPPLAPAIPGFVRQDAFEERVAIDSGSLPQLQAEDTFYINACDRFNAGEEVVQLKQVTDLALNRLSTATRKETSTAVGNAKCIFRVDQSEFNISDRKLDLLNQRGMFVTVSQTTRGDIIKANLQKEVTWYFLDDLIVTAFEADVLTNWGGDTYRNFVEQPLLAVDFWAQELGGEQLQDLFDRQEALSGCTVTDKIAYGKGRCFAHVEGVNGLINIARDSSLNNPVSVNQSPFIPEVALANSGRGSISYDRFPFNPAVVFVHAASEVFYPLPNGCAGVRLEDGAGVGAGFAPADIVLHGDLRNIDSQIRGGICLDCHREGKSQGYEEAAYNLVNAAGSPFNEDDKLRAEVFMSDTRIRQHLREFNGEMAECHAFAGALPGAFTNRGVFPLRDGLTPREMSGKLMVPEDEYLDCLAGANQSAGDLGGHLQGSNLSLAVIAQRTGPDRTGPNAYDNIIRECNYWINREI
jgi:hypothetical protein